MAALLLLFGCLGEHLAQRVVSAIFGAAAFIAAFVATTLVLALSVWRTRVLSRWAASTVAAGLIPIPVLGATPIGIAGSNAGNVVPGVGLIGLGRSVAAIR